MDGWMDGRMDRWMDAWMDAWIDGCMLEEEAYSIEELEVDCFVCGRWGKSFLSGRRM